MPKYFNQGEYPSITIEWQTSFEQICANTTREGEIAVELKKIASDHKSVSIGSYPYNNKGNFGTNIEIGLTKKH